MLGDGRILDGLARRQLEPWLIAIVKFLLANTQVSVTPLVPEIALRLGTESVSLWDRVEREFDRTQAGPPYWAFAWAGGQALARHLLDNPDIVSGRRVLDLASGSGVAGIAAKKAGAARVIANDVDYLATIAIALNAEANDVVVEANATDLLTEDTAFDLSSIDVVLIGDGFYDCKLSPRILSFAMRCRAVGSVVLIGDPGRADLPIDRLARVRDYVVPVTKGRQYTAVAGVCDDHDLRRVTVWMLNF
jgi:predicted nicotinamide N-methyase